MCHFYTVSLLNRPFNATVICERYFLFIVSSHNFSIPFIDVRENYSPLKSSQKHITIAESKQYISFIFIISSLVHSKSHPSNKSFIISLLTPKYCFLITPIRSFESFINFPNHGTLVGHAVSVNFPRPWHRWYLPFPAPQLHINRPKMLSLLSCCPTVGAQHISLS